MNAIEFGSQMKRLVSVFGAKNYPQERADLIWKEFKHEPDFLFIEMISSLISEYRTSPVLSDFRTERAKIREKEYLREKKLNQKPQFLPGEEYITYAEYIRRIIDGKRHQEIQEAVKFGGWPKLEEFYEKGKKEKETGIEDKTNIAKVFMENHFEEKNEMTKN